MTASSGKEAVANARAIHTYPKGYCQKFTRQSWEVGSLYGSAIEAWNGAAEKHPGDRNPPTGAPCYYRGGQYGHAVVHVEHDSGDIRSTDCQSSGNVSDTDLSWPERQWGYTYLGWTGDINGVDLPLTEGDEDMPLSNDDVEKVANAVWDRLLSGQPDTKEARKAGPTLVNAFRAAYDGPDNVWDTKLMGQKDAPDGRYASATLSNIHNMLVELSKKS